ncbi:8093_t:CDS:2 [Funneliformis geosporum]|uniref:3563_t:CDS:1 n=1 Tax=Funneliformis geosporum TaxID=1117311 RepID=A0A9W4WX39_9GLOM|nr:8093_t:CDS:2 [Funneliformis geosporum]CAI2185565.1 3563_t:CDS:2 [Funneliformis geosporum]
MPRHSKNNTALSFFTYAEGKALDYGTKKQRLGRDSMREYDSCYLCLQRARDPVCCTQAKEAVIQEFERQQVRITPITTSNNGTGEVKSKINGSLLSESNAPGKKTDVEKYPASARIEDNPVKAIEWIESFHKGGKKRKFQIDEEELAAIAKREQEDALKKLEEERPSLTPSAEPDKVKQVKQQTMCTAANPEHSINMKSLIPTKFTEDKDPTSKTINLICPSCRKTLTNSLKICLMKTCGHVICKICVDRLVRKTKQCFVCDAKCRDKDIADMSGEGTGFASGGGKVVAEKFDVAFQ